MKEKWTTPRTVIEEFTPNDYIAACWEVGCECDEANEYELIHPNEEDPVSHSWGGCGNSHNQILIDYGNDGKPDRMIERSKYLGSLPCTIYVDGNYSSLKDISTIQPGDYIYWTTSSSLNNRVWHHQGKVSRRENAS